ncbi:hypothetical protein ACTJKO_08240 [Curtobacterium sp. 22159]|jgi:gas vesicle protein|uniref:hypothetical protein n=1 Tax=Curtobacterium sp. 22159 TaxID=3453882 RepID=UPI003F85897B
MPSKTIALVTAALAVTLLAGCSAGGPGSGDGATTAAKDSSSQSKSEACKAFESKVKSAAEGLQSQVSKLQSDPSAAVAKLKEFDGSLSDGVDAVSNPTVKPKAEAFHAAYTDMLTQIEAIAKDPKSADLSKFQETTSKVQDAGNDFDKTCSS